MATPYIGEIRMGGWNFAPQNWAFCNGQLQSISQNTTLFQLIGTTYGGDGVSTFALPNLQSRMPVHQGTSYVIGQTGGAETVILNTSQLPIHNHPVTAQGGTGNSTVPTGGFLAGSSEGQYASAASGVTATLLQNNSGGQPHDNLMPYATINYVIALFGVFPTQN